MTTNRVDEIRKKLNRIQAQTGVWQGCISFDGSEIDTLLAAYDEQAERIEQADLERKGALAWSKIDKERVVDAETRTAKLEADNDRLRQALEPFASIISQDKHEITFLKHQLSGLDITVGDFRRAADAVKGESDGME